MNTRQNDHSSTAHELIDNQGKNYFCTQAYSTVSLLGSEYISDFWNEPSCPCKLRSKNCGTSSHLALCKYFFHNSGLMTWMEDSCNTVCARIIVGCRFSMTNTRFGKTTAPVQGTNLLIIIDHHYTNL